MSTGAAEALQQALIAAANDSSERATAVHALRGSSVWAATWPTDPATLRTLTNSNGVTALAVFSDEDELEEAAIRYAWLGVDGHVPSKHLHMSEVVRFAKQHRAQLLVIDIAADHALELDEGDMELLSSLPSTRPPSYQGMAAVNPSRPPTSLSNRPPSQQKLNAVPSTRPPSQSALKPTSVIPEDPNKPASGVSATFGAATGNVQGLPGGPSDALFDALAHVLRDYPEVEWGCLLRHTRGTGEPAPCIAIRIDPSFRKNVNEISVKLREASIAHGEAYDVLMLDAPDQMKHARQNGRPFYPWRKK